MVAPATLSHEILLLGSQPLWRPVHRELIPAGPGVEDRGGALATCLGAARTCAYPPPVQECLEATVET